MSHKYVFGILWEGAARYFRASISRCSHWGLGEPLWPAGAGEISNRTTIYHRSTCRASFRRQHLSPRCRWHLIYDVGRDAFRNFPPKTATIRNGSIIDTLGDLRRQSSVEPVAPITVTRTSGRERWRWWLWWGRAAREKLARINAARCLRQKYQCNSGLVYGGSWSLNNNECF